MATGLEVPLAALSTTALTLVKHQLNMVLPDLELVILDNIEWSLDPTSVSAELDLLV